MTVYGTYETIDGKPAVRFERRYPHPVERVWRAVTEPEELAHWFPSSVEVDLREGGRMSFTFPDADMEPTGGTVTELDPPHRFAFLWGDEQLRIELEPDGEGCLMRFTHVLSTREAAARDGAGWHVCLDRLETRLSGGAAEAPGSGVTGEWRELYEEYRRRGAPAGAPVPGLD
jgi:uncharacterized protein YndB with AHSA1/START domain